MKILAILMLAVVLEIKNKKAGFKNELVYQAGVKVKSYLITKKKKVKVKSKPKILMRWRLVIMMLKTKRLNKNTNLI